MISTTRRFFHLFLALAAVGASTASLLAQEPDTDGETTSESAAGSGETGSEEARKSKGLDEEQKRRVREALRQAWTDPAVVSAREEVRVATESYQEAIRKAVGEADPDVAQALRRLQSINESEVRRRIGSPPMAARPRRGLPYPMSPPGFVERLPSDLRERFQEAEKQARDTEEVRQAREALEELREEDEELRERRMELHRRLRMATLDAMVEIDPSLEHLRERLLEFRRRSGGPRGGRPKAE